MAYQVKPFAEVLKLTKEKLDEALAPVRARAANAKATLEMAKLEESMIDLETQITNACSEKELDFEEITDLIDQYDLLERRTKQITTLIGELFPEGA